MRGIGGKRGILTNHRDTEITEFSVSFVSLW